MNSKLIVMLALWLLLLSSVIMAQDDAPSNTNDSTNKTIDTTSNGIYIIANYFHGDMRCVTCKKLEAYSAEALQAGFEGKMSDSTLVWNPVNYDNDDNKHFIDDYSLFTKALILSKIKEGHEVEWKNLDKIWQLVGNKEDFIRYVQEETAEFIVGNKTDE